MKSKSALLENGRLNILLPLFEVFVFFNILPLFLIVLRGILLSLNDIQVLQKSRIVFHSPATKIDGHKRMVEVVGLRMEEKKICPESLARS
jgi:hypothetical protein